MHIRSTEFLQLLVQSGGYIEFEMGFPRGQLKQNLITLKAPDGRGLELRNSSGYRFSPVELARPIFDDLVRANLIHQDGSEREGQRLIFRPTADGIKRGTPKAAAPQWLIERLQNSDRPPSKTVQRIAEQYITAMAASTNKPRQEQ